MPVQGFHQLTPDGADALRTVNLYTGVFGLRRVKQTVNFGDTNGPDRYIDELVTAGSGFLVGDDKDALGSRLQLPPWLERSLPLTERKLKPLAVSPAAASHVRGWALTSGA